MNGMALGSARSVIVDNTVSDMISSGSNPVPADNMRDMVASCLRSSIVSSIQACANLVLRQRVVIFCFQCAERHDGLCNFALALECSSAMKVRQDFICPKGTQAEHSRTGR